MHEADQSANRVLPPVRHTGDPATTGESVARGLGSKPKPREQTAPAPGLTLGQLREQVEADTDQGWHPGEVLKVQDAPRRSGASLAAGALSAMRGRR